MRPVKEMGELKPFEKENYSEAQAHENLQGSQGRTGLTGKSQKVLLKE